MRSLETRPNDQRDSLRCPVETTRQACEITIGTVRYPARLLDESAGGFAVLVRLPLGAPLRREAVLGVDNHWFRAGIVHASEITAVEESERNAASVPTESADDGVWYRLGLRRLAEIQTPFDVRVSQSPTKESRLSPTTRAPRTTLIIVSTGILFAILAAAFLLMR